MSDFKVGDEVWFLHTEFGQDKWENGTTLCLADEIYLETGTIIDIIPKRDRVYVYIKDCKNLCMIGFEVNGYLYKSKQDCIDAFKKRLEEL